MVKIITLYLLNKNINRIERWYFVLVKHTYERKLEALGNFKLYSYCNLFSYFYRLLDNFRKLLGWIRSRNTYGFLFMDSISAPMDCKSTETSA